jgi:hypothetical protein
MTWADIARHKGAPGVAVAAPGEAAPAAPAEEPAEAEQVAPQLKFAPRGTWGVVLADIGRLADSPIAKQMQQQMPVPQADQAGKPGTVAVFMLPDEGDITWCGLMEMEELNRDQFEQQITEAQGVQTKTVAGLDAYVAEQPGTPGSLIMALADESTFLLAGSESALGIIADAYGSGGGAGVGSDLQQMLNIYPDESIRLAAALPPELLSQAGAGQPVPEQVSAVQVIAAGIDLTDQINVGATMRMSGADAAEQLAADANAKLDEARQSLKQQIESNPDAAGMFQPVLPVLDKLSLSADGADVKGSLQVSQQELEGLMGAGMMMLMGGMGPGAMGPPSGGFEMQMGPPPGSFGD